MYSMSDIKRLVGTYEGYKLSDDENSVVRESDGAVICSTQELLQKTRERAHCDFESIYSEHVSLFDLLRCRQCGTVIFTYDDEHYDPHLRCPTCGGYNTSFKFWTKEDIDNDPHKKDEIELYKKMAKEQAESYKRYKARGDRYDWQLWDKKVKTKKYLIKFAVENITGLTFKIQIAIHDEKLGGYVYKHFINIPITPVAWYRWVRYLIMRNKTKNGYRI